MDAGAASPDPAMSLATSSFYRGRLPVKGLTPSQMASAEAAGERGWLAPIRLVQKGRSRLIAWLLTEDCKLRWRTDKAVTAKK